MKRFIAILSLALMAGCALAFADDSDSANTGSDAIKSAQNTGQDISKSMDQTATTVDQTAKAAKTCTDESGNVLKKGETGFKTCWDAEHPKQESGTAGAVKQENKMDSNSDHANPSGSNDTSDAQNTNPSTN